MTAEVSGYLRWSAQYDGTAQWLLFIDGHAGELPTVRPLHDPNTARETDRDTLQRLVGDVFHQDTGAPPIDLSLTRVEGSHAYRFHGRYAEG